MSFKQHNKLANKNYEITNEEKQQNSLEDPLVMEIHKANAKWIEQENAKDAAKELNAKNKILEISNDSIDVKKNAKKADPDSLLDLGNQSIQSIGLEDEDEEEEIIITEKKQDNVIKVQKDNAIKVQKDKGGQAGKEETLTDKQSILAWERRTNDYEKYGIAYDLEHCKANAADSPTMRELKRALADYLQARDEILSSRNAMSKERQELAVNSKRDFEFIHNAEIRNDYQNVYYNHEDIGTVNRDCLGKYYDKLIWALAAYDGGITLFKHGRGRKRLNQVARIRERLAADNRQLWLSPERRAIKNSGEDDRAENFSKGWPTYKGMIRNKDMIANRMQRYKDRKRRGEKVRFWHGWGRNIRDTAAMAWHGILGSVERAAGLPMMLAGNALKLTGKIAKLPLQMLSGAFNQCCKWAKSDVRWRMDSFKDTWKKGWVGYNDGRKAFRDILRLGVVMPAVSALELVFLEIIPIRLIAGSKNHFDFAKTYFKMIGAAAGPQLRQIIKGMGITSKHYKDRSLLTPEDMGDTSGTYNNNFDDDEDDGNEEE